MHMEFDSRNAWQQIILLCKLITKHSVRNDLETPLSNVNVMKNVHQAWLLKHLVTNHLVLQTAYQAQCAQCYQLETQSSNVIKKGHEL